MSKKVTEDSLASNQRRAIETLVTTGNISKAAESANVTRKTVHKWLKQDDFKQTLKEAEAEALDNLSRRLVSLSDKATSAIEGVLEDSDAGTGHRLRASDIVLANLLKIRELVDLEARILALEESLQNRGDNESN